MYGASKSIGKRILPPRKQRTSDADGRGTRDGAFGADGVLNGTCDTDGTDGALDTVYNTDRALNGAWGTRRACEL